MNDIVLGILGGLGPMSGAHFYEEIIAHTNAHSDSEHIDVILSGKASTPDRTAYIMGTSEISPLPDMQKSAIMLEKAGASIIAIPCNTAHYFYEQISSVVDIPVINIINETVSFAKACGYKKIGVFATFGTRKADSYRRFCEKYGLECIYPNEEDQNKISSIIYDSVKASIKPDIDEFLEIADRMKNMGSECIILGCTELSLIDIPENRRLDFLDSTQVLTYKTILACGKKPQGFDIRFGG